MSPDESFEQWTPRTNIRRNNKLEQYGTQYGARQAKAASIKPSANSKRQVADDTADAKTIPQATKKSSKKKRVITEGGKDLLV